MVAEVVRTCHSYTNRIRSNLAYILSVNLRLSRAIWPFPAWSLMNMVIETQYSTVQYSVDSMGRRSPPWSGMNIVVILEYLHWNFHLAQTEFGSMKPPLISTSVQNKPRSLFCIQRHAMCNVQHPITTNAVLRRAALSSLISRVLALSGSSCLLYNPWYSSISFSNKLRIHRIRAHVTKTSPSTEMPPGQSIRVSSPSAEDNWSRHGQVTRISSEINHLLFTQGPRFLKRLFISSFGTDTLLKGGVCLAGHMMHLGGLSAFPSCLASCLANITTRQKSYRRLLLDQYTTAMQPIA